MKPDYQQHSTHTSPRSKRYTESGAYTTHHQHPQEMITHGGSSSSSRSTSSSVEQFRSPSPRRSPGKQNKAVLNIPRGRGSDGKRNITMNFYGEGSSSSSSSSPSTYHHASSSSSGSSSSSSSSSSTSSSNKRKTNSSNSNKPPKKRKKDQQTISREQLESKTHLGFMRNISPGDMIRYVHSIQRLYEGFGGKAPIKQGVFHMLATESAFNRARGMFADVELLVNDFKEMYFDGVTYKMYSEKIEGGEIRWMVVQNGLMDKQERIKDQIERAFKYVNPKQNVTKENSLLLHYYDGKLKRLPKTWEDIRIDRGEIMKDVVFDPKRTSLEQESSKGKEREDSPHESVLLFVRRHTDEAGRNTQPSQLEAVHREATEKGWTVTLAGQGKVDDYHKFLGEAKSEYLSQALEKKTLILWPYEQHSIREQMAEYSRYRAAIGNNASGLDIASVANIPVLRDLDFPHVMDKEINYDHHHNDFLARKLNMGIEPKMVKSGGDAIHLTKTAKTRLISQKEGRYPTEKTGEQFGDLLNFFLELVKHDFADEQSHIAVPDVNLDGDTWWNTKWSSNQNTLQEKEEQTEEFDYSGVWGSMRHWEESEEWEEQPDDELFSYEDFLKWTLEVMKDHRTVNPRGNENEIPHVPAHEVGRQMSKAEGKQREDSIL